MQSTRECVYHLPARSDFPPSVPGIAREARGVFWCALSFIVLVCLAAEFAPRLAAALQLERGELAAGQWWRLLTCHFVHWNGDHLFWDLLAFVTLAVAAHRIDRRRLTPCLLVASVAIPISVLWFQPTLQTYRGLSGLDTSLFALLAACLFRQQAAQQNWRGVLIVVILTGLLAAKTGFELVTHDTLFVNAQQAGFQPVPLAHVIGAVVGLVTGALPQRPARP